MLGENVVTFTPIVVELPPYNSLVELGVETCASAAIPLSITPVLVG